MKTIEINGFAHWASYLVNGDDSGLDAADIEEVHQWAEENNVEVVHCLNADNWGFGRVSVGGTSMQGDCMSYTFSVGE